MERRRAILDAAESLLTEQGYEAATLKAVGERAGIPIASLYHYFPDRHQVDAELLRRHRDALDPLVGKALEAKGADTLRAATDAVIDAMRDYFRAHPSCVELWFAGRHTLLVELVHSFDQTQAERTWHFLRTRGLISEDTPPHVLEFVFEVGNRLFDVAFRRSASGDETVIDEARRITTAYLETYAPRA